LSAKQGGSDIKNNINSKEISVLLGAGIEFSLLGSSATIEGRYCQGIDNVYKNVPHVNIKNKVSQIFVGFLF
jgi:L-rhamnose isomerase